MSDGKANTIPVPKGFYYVGGILASGVVISDDARDKDKYKGIEDVPAGAVYSEDGTVKTYTDEEYNNLTAEQKKAVLMGNQFVWIPCNEANYKKENFVVTNNNG